MNYRDALNKFIDDMNYLKNDEVEGIIFYGSFHTGTYNEFSDIDLMILYDDDSDINQIKGFKTVNGLQVEYYERTVSKIYERANSNEPFMGLKTFKGDLPVLSDVIIAKNYLTEDELKILNNLVSGYFDFAELQAIRHKAMYMKDYLNQLDSILLSTGENLLKDGGSISREEALQKAKKEYKKYQVKELSPVEKAYLKTLKEVNKKVSKKNNF